MAKPHIMILDDDEAVRLSLSSVLATYGFRVSSFSEVLTALETLKTSPVDCIVLDVRMPDMDGLAAQRLISNSPPAPPIIMITGHGDIATAVRAMKNGAFDFIEKPVDDEQLVASIAAALKFNRRTWQSDHNIQVLIKRYATLTTREKTIASMVANGYSSAAIAAVLDISVRTVDHHRAKILAKMQATSLSQLLRFLLAVVQEDLNK
jgi:FixJ family two-component response regulator